MSSSQRRSDHIKLVLSAFNSSLSVSLAPRGYPPAHHRLHLLHRRAVWSQRPTASPPAFAWCSRALSCRSPRSHPGQRTAAANGRKRMFYYHIDSHVLPKGSNSFNPPCCLHHNDVYMCGQHFQHQLGIGADNQSGPTCQLHQRFDRFSWRINGNHSRHSFQLLLLLF